MNGNASIIFIKMKKNACIAGKHMVKYILLRQYKIRLVGQGVKTPPSHGGIMGSIPVRATGCQNDLAAFLVEILGKILFLEMTCILVKNVIIFIC